MTRFFTISNTRNIFESLLSPPHILHKYTAQVLFPVSSMTPEFVGDSLSYPVRESCRAGAEQNSKQRMLGRRCKTTAELALPRSTLYKYRAVM